MTRYEEEKRESICWFSKASDLRGAAAVLWASMNSDSHKIAIELGLVKGFDMSVASALPLLLFHLPWRGD